MDLFEQFLSLIPGAAAFTAFLGALIIIAVIAIIVLYVYWALVLMTLAKKLRHEDKAFLAWIPLVQFFLLPILAKKHWAWGFILLVPIANIIFLILWTWNIFEQRKYPGWLSLIGLLGFIPVLGAFAAITNLVIWGVVAWNDLR